VSDDETENGSVDQCTDDEDKFEPEELEEDEECEKSSDLHELSAAETDVDSDEDEGDELPIAGV